ncbi:MAG: IS982 family transposase [Bacteroidetes bacterium]|nr:IS982 family transposase [Bacteroidota bacterium]
MDIKVKEQKLLEIFIWTDDFVKAFDGFCLPPLVGQRRRTPRLALSEMATILIFYHHSGYKCFEYYYEHCVLNDLRGHFPKAPSYTRFVQLIPRSLKLLYWMGQIRGRLAQATGAYFVDSKKLPVCDNRRIHSHKVFKNIAQRGKTSTGWFFGLKIHLVINNLGEIMSFVITAGNVMDNAKGVLDKLFEFIQGKCFGDKGYISKYFEFYYQKGLQLITRIRKNMKNRPMDWCDKMMLYKRGVIESVNDILMTVFDMDHTRHRSPINAVTHMLGAVLAYSFYDSKPCVFNPAFINKH